MITYEYNLNAYIIQIGLKLSFFFIDIYYAFIYNVIIIKNECNIHQKHEVILLWIYLLEMTSAIQKQKRL